jgi:hypothetical protein
LDFKKMNRCRCETIMIAFPSRLAMDSFLSGALNLGHRGGSFATELVALPTQSVEITRHLRYRAGAKLDG